MAKRNYIVIRSNDGMKICEAEWTRLRSRIDFMLARYHPDFASDLTQSGKPLGDTKRPRQPEAVPAMDMI